jgi:hypothetical protein
MTAVGMDFGFDRPRVRAAAPASHLRITARGRAVLLFLVAVPLVIAAALFALNGGGAVASQEMVAGVEYQYVTVEAGESLWQLAGEIAPTADPRDVIVDILAFNGMSSSEVFPGQQLALPTQYAK